MLCKYCGDAFVPRTLRQIYCSINCNREADKKRKRQRATERGAHDKKSCPICSVIFVPKTSRDKFCSEKCRRKSDNQNEKAKIRRREYAKAHRKRYEGIVIDSDISLLKLSNRDKCQCKICGLKVDWTDSPQGDMYPSIDHIKPRSLGGLHSWDNIQLAHRKCNYMKSNKYIG